MAVEPVELSVAVEPSFLRVAWLALEGVRVGSGNAEIAAELAALAEEIRANFAGRDLASNQMVQEVRRAFSAAGTEPTRYRPSSEALCRRLIKGETPPAINDAVDVNNLTSLETLIPCGIYDRAALTPPFEVRIGREGESYETHSGRRLDLYRKLVIADAQGCFGSPISDSGRAGVAPGERQLLFVLFAPVVALDGFLKFQLDQARRRFGHWMSAVPTASGVAAAPASKG